jgi:flagellar protein FlaG
MSSSELTMSQSYSPPSMERMPTPEVNVQSKSEPSPAPISQPIRKDIKSFDELKHSEQKGEAIPISDEQLVEAIQKAIKAAEGITTSLEFSVHKETHRISVKVLDKETGELIREIPPEKNLDFLATLWRKAGILIDEKR